MANRLLHSKRRKKKTNSPLIKIILTNHLFAKMSEGTRTLLFFSFPVLLRLFAPLLGPHRNAAKEWKAGKTEGT
jgi:hypothetical protein